MEFEFPDVCNEQKQNDEIDKANETIEQMKTKYDQFVDNNKNRPALPGWFSI